jgi:hypothetical protein
LETGDPKLLVFEAEKVLERAKAYGDLFEPVLKLKQKIPRLEALQGMDTAGAAPASPQKPTRPKAATRPRVAKKSIPAKKKAAARKRV